MHIEITKRAVHGSDRFELHLGGSIYVFSLERGEKLAKNILSLLGIEVAQLEAELDALIEWVNTDNPIEGRQKWYAMPEHIQDRIAPCPYA